MSTELIRPRDRDAILQSLKAGVVPRVGLQYIQVGRVHEVESLISDLERIADGGSAIRFVIGEYGAGKTFFLSLIRTIALEKKLVTMHADLNPDRRLQSSGGEGRSLYTELARSASTRSKPDGGAIPAIVERFVSNAIEEALTEGIAVDHVIRSRLESLQEMVSGYDFASVIQCYWRGHESQDVALTDAAIRWLRAEYSTKTDAKRDLGVRTIIDDDNVYDMLKLLARFVRLAGYGGLLVCLDEMVNLYKLSNAQARRANYEQILRILNDSLQGSADGLGFLMGGTPEFLQDPRRGLYSYEALATRLAENSFAKDGLSDFNAPVIRLSNLSPEDLYVLLLRLRNVFAGGDESAYLVPDEALTSFMTHCSQRIGDSYFRTPRTTIRAFVDMLSILEQNPQTEWTDLISKTDVVADKDPTIDNGGADDELASIKL